VIKNWNVPNFLTTLRVLAVPFFIYFLFEPDTTSHVIALVLFGFASVTDFVDGYLARRWKQETEFGKFLDPLADKALVLGAFITFIFLSPQIQLWMVICIIGRDLLITLLRSVAIRRGTSLRTSMFGKVKTAFQMFAIIVILLSFLFVSYKERKKINSIYEDSYDAGIDPLFVAIEHFSEFLDGNSQGFFYGLATFLPYTLMFVTTILTVISGLRYVMTNYRLLVWWKPLPKKDDGK